VFPYLDINDFEEDLFSMVRKTVSLNNANHLWSEMTNEELLVSARLRLKDAQTGKEGYTLAAALLFGKENTLASVLPHYKTDAICRKNSTDLYDDRYDIRCNLLRAYSRLLEFVHKHLPDRPYIEGTQRISLRDKIFREVVANLLVHREFSNAFPATMTIYKDIVVTENWNRPNIIGRVSLKNLKPFPKNPTISNFFRQLGWVEELGSGVRNMFKYCPIYVKGAYPVIDEGDIFKMTIRHEVVNNESVDVGFPLEKGQEKEILTILKENPSISIRNVAERQKMSIKAVRIILDRLKREGVIVRVGADKGGSWQIIVGKRTDF